MSIVYGRTYLLLLGCLLFFPIAPGAQQSEGRPQGQSPPPARKGGPAKTTPTEQQRRGEALFVQNCPLCHIPSQQKKMLGLLGPTLRGVYEKDADEDSLRQIIQQGFPGEMPAFRYDLEPNQIDDIIAFLKAGADTRIPSN